MVKVKGLWRRGGGGGNLPLLTVWCSLLVCSILAARASDEGEPCRFQKGPGVCIGYSTCRPLLESLNGRISICSYNAREAVVCCPQDYQTKLQTLAAAQQSLTISAKKCIEYMRLATPTTIFSSLKPNAEVVQKKSKLCSNDNNLIVGGEAAKLGEFPHMGAIGYRNPDTGRVEFRCGATLISERFVLTAAHCRNADAVVVRLGDLDLESEADGADPRDFEIEEFIKHPEYTSRTKYNDIALVRLATPVQINSRIRPACLYQSKEIRQQKLIATGYGAMENFGSNANQLLKVVLDQYTQEACQQAYANDGRPLSRGIVDSQFCAGYEPGGRDTCQGDSGGPLQVRDEQDSCRFYVAAVTSFGKFCGTSTPGIYTRVGAYLGWIEQIVWGNGQTISEAADPDKDFVFPDLQELGLGDRCTVKGYQGGPQLVGVCRRVRECATFPQRVIQRQFNFFDDLCYFEVHDPVVCCLSPADASRGGSRIAQEDQWPEYEQINAV
ncbi:hypothetical protein pipiens_011769 [Culex pipiens pipiens]|uniref:Uncharacterized protein n=1 Tax=Culex pipiens pipiens TaxID=38569 RepID=A0ABD1D502_CULPP